MWLVRNKETKEMVMVADEKPPPRDPLTPRVGEVPWEEQIDLETEEIVELPGQAQDVSEAANAVGEVASIVIADDGSIDVLPSTVGTPPTPQTEVADAGLRAVEELKQGRPPAQAVTMDDLTALFDKIKANSTP